MNLAVAVVVALEEGYVVVIAVPVVRDGVQQRRAGRFSLSDGQRMAGLYPLAHLPPGVPGDDAPHGLLFVLTESFARLCNPTTNRILRPKIDVGGFRTWWTQASSVLLPIEIDREGVGPRQVRIMVVGGGSRGQPDGSPALDTAAVYTYDVAGRTLAREGSLRLNRPRFMGDAILLRREGGGRSGPVRLRNPLARH